MLSLCLKESNLNRQDVLNFLKTHDKSYIKSTPETSTNQTTLQATLIKEISQKHLKEEHKDTPHESELENIVLTLTKELILMLLIA